MTRNEPEPIFLDARSSDRLAGLVFELAAQLHAERAQRIALQAALSKRGLIDDGDVEAAAGADDTARDITAALELSQRRLIDVLVELDDVSGPLRHEATPDPPRPPRHDAGDDEGPDPKGGR